MCFFLMTYSLETQLHLDSRWTGSRLCNGSLLKLVPSKAIELIIKVVCSFMEGKHDWQPEFDGSLRAPNCL